MRRLRSHTTCTAHGTLYTPHSTALRTGGAEGECGGGGWSSGSHNILHTVLFSGLLRALHWSARPVASHTAGPGGGCGARSDAGEGRSLYPTRSPAQWTVSRVILPRTLPSFTPRRHGGRAGQSGVEKGGGHVIPSALLSSADRLAYCATRHSVQPCGLAARDRMEGKEGEGVQHSSLRSHTLHCTVHCTTQYEVAGRKLSSRKVLHTGPPCALRYPARCAVLHTGGVGQREDGGRRAGYRAYTVFHTLSCPAQYSV